MGFNFYVGYSWDSPSTPNLYCELSTEFPQPSSAHHLPYWGRHEGLLQSPSTDHRVDGRPSRRPPHLRGGFYQPHETIAGDARRMGLCSRGPNQDLLCFLVAGLHPRDLIAPLGLRVLKKSSLRPFDGPSEALIS